MCGDRSEVRKPISHIGPASVDCVAAIRKGWRPASIGSRPFVREVDHAVPVKVLSILQGEETRRGLEAFPVADVREAGFMFYFHAVGNRL